MILQQALNGYKEGGEGLALFLVNGVKLKGTIIDFDETHAVLEYEGHLSIVNLAHVASILLEHRSTGIAERINPYKL